MLLHLLQIVGSSIAIAEVWFIWDNRRLWFWRLRAMGNVSDRVHYEDLFSLDGNDDLRFS
jgi:hypothetical protein